MTLCSTVRVYYRCGGGLVPVFSWRLSSGELVALRRAASAGSCSMAAVVRAKVFDRPLPVVSEPVVVVPVAVFVDEVGERFDDVPTDDEYWEPA